MFFYKKILTVTLIASIWFWQLGYYFFYIQQQYTIKKNILKLIAQKQHLNQSDFILVNVNSKDFKWYEQGKEIIYNNNLYDIVDVKIEKENKFFVCVNDEKENDLLSLFCKNFKKNSQTKKQISFPLSLVYCQSIHQIDIFFSNIISNKKYFTYNNSMFFIFSKKNYPPPKTIV